LKGITGSYRLRAFGELFIIRNTLM